ncbi:MAG: flippase [Clostridia bacterium]|nr:flippase [Clostridia bacterium]
MGQKSVKKNFLYNIVYQVFAIVLPLITTPYIARIIGPEGSGVNSYTYSIANYFVIFALLGIANYGNRLIAQNRDNKEKLNYEFTSLFILHVIISLIVLAMYLIFVFFIANNYKIYFIVQGLFVISALFDISWLFFGLEEFKTTVVRNIVIRLIALILIFTFVKSATDLIKYIIILQGSTLLSQLVLFPFLKKNKIKFVKVRREDVLKHFKPMLILFIPVIAVSIYKMMDKVMLGYMVDVKEVGLYEYGERIINLPMTLITALGTVMLPRMSNLVAKGDDETFKLYISKSIKFALFMSMPLCIGLIIVANDFIPFFLGDAYNKTIIIVQILAVTIPIISFANVLRTQYLLPKSMDKEFILSLSLGAIVNLVFNIILINKYNSIGACISTVLAELVVMVYQSIMISKKMNTFTYVKTALEFLSKAFAMGIVVWIFCNIMKINIIIKIILEVIIGVFIYFILNIKYIFRDLLKSHRRSNV